jgi:hypothetical protein
MIELSMTKETKNTVKYDTDGTSSDAIVTVYVQKHSLPRPFPEKIKLTLEVVE